MSKQVRNGEFFTDQRLGFVATAALLTDTINKRCGEERASTSCVFIDLCCGDGGLVSYNAQNGVINPARIILNDVDQDFLDIAVKNINGSESNKLHSKPIDLLKTPAKDIAELILNHKSIKDMDVTDIMFLFNPPYAVVKDKSDVDCSLFEDLPSYGNQEKCVLCLHQLGKIIHHMKAANIGVNYHAALITKSLFSSCSRSVNKGAQAAIYPHLKLMRLMLTPAKTFFKVSGNWPVSITTWTDLEEDGVEMTGPPLGTFYDVSKKDVKGLSAEDLLDFMEDKATKVKIPIFYADPFLEEMRDIISHNDWPNWSR